VGTLVKWLKKEGDPVTTGDILAEVETDKATMELESFFDGVLLKIFSPAGSQVPIGAALCAVGKAGEKVETPKNVAPAPAAPPAVTGNATLPSGTPTPAQPAPAAPGKANQEIGVPKTPAPAPAKLPSTESPRVPGERIRISPLARKFAREKGIDYTRLAGSGRGGRIVRADIVAAVEGGGISNFKSQIPNPNAVATATGGQRPIQEERTVAVSNMRATIARRLLEAKTTIPHFYLDIELDAEPLLTLRQQLNAALEKEGVKLSVNDFILKAAAEALRRVPAVNASWENTQIRYFAAAHVSFAVSIEDGLITPVIRDAHNKTVFQISAEAKTLGKRAKEKKLAPAEFTGGTFCVSNLGMMGITKFNAVINPPNSAILGVGTTVTKPVVKNGQIVVGQTMTLTLSCDHRVVDGALGAQYLAALIALLEAPALLLM